MTTDGQWLSVLAVEWSELSWKSFYQGKFFVFVFSFNFFIIISRLKTSNQPVSVTKKKQITSLIVTCLIFFYSSTTKWTQSSRSFLLRIHGRAVEDFLCLACNSQMRLCLLLVEATQTLWLSNFFLPRSLNFNSPFSQSSSNEKGRVK